MAWQCHPLQGLGQESFLLNIFFLLVLCPGVHIFLTWCPFVQSDKKQRQIYRSLSALPPLYSCSSSSDSPAFPLAAPSRPGHLSKFGSPSIVFPRPWGHGLPSKPCPPSKTGLPSRPPPQVHESLIHPGDSQPPHHLEWGANKAATLSCCCEALLVDTQVQGVRTPNINLANINLVMWREFLLTYWKKLQKKNRPDKGICSHPAVNQTVFLVFNLVFIHICWKIETTATFYITTVSEAAGYA